MLTVEQKNNNEIRFIELLSKLNIDLTEASDRAAALQETVNEFERKREEIEKLLAK